MYKTVKPTVYISVIMNQKYVLKLLSTVNNLHV